MTILSSVLSNKPQIKTSKLLSIFFSENLSVFAINPFQRFKVLLFAKNTLHLFVN